MDINLLVNITSRAWALKILELMHAGTPGRQAALLYASGAGRTAFAQSLHHLVELKLVERNPGHGHPLRPEFRLTPNGAQAAAMAHRINTAPVETAERSLLRRAWTIPILAVSSHPIYFTGIKSELVSISDRALSQALTELRSRDWVECKIDLSARPPRPIYQAVNAGVLIGEATGIA